MIRLNEIRFDGARAVEGYGRDFFRIGGARIEGHVIVTPQAVLRWGGLQDLPPLVALAGEIDILLLGTGAAMARAPGELVAALDALGIGVEPMDSAAAARTYNVLLSEGRRAGAALLTIG